MQHSRSGFGQYRDFDGPSMHFGEGGGGAGARGRGYRPRGGGGGGGKFKKSFSDEVREQVDELFSKKFKFQDEYDQWCLPDPSTIFKERPFQVPKLLELKTQLNTTKGKLEDKELNSWHRHTNFTNRAGGVIPMLRREFQPELCTQAWAKFHEILWTFDIVPQAASKCYSVHLCEAPGAFVASLNHFLKTHRMDCEWKWKASTLNPYYEGNDHNSMIDQDRFISETLNHWYMGVDNSGNVMHWENAVGFREIVKSELEEVHLVTADGSINCVENPGEQEVTVAQLFFCEVLLGLLLLRARGSLLIKTFTTFEHSTICLMYLLACCFTELHVFKPATSKAGNSEQYVVCLGYKGSSVLTQRHFDKLRQAFGPSPSARAMFPLSSIPQSFLSQIINCATKFAKYQMNTIEENLRLYDCMRFSEKQFIIDMKDLTCERYKTWFKLKNLPREKAVVQHIFLTGSFHLSVTQTMQGDPSSQWAQKRSIESFLARVEKKKRKGVWSSKGEVEEEPQPPATKQPRLAQPEVDTEAIQYVLTALDYESERTQERLRDQRGEGPVAMEMEPEEVQWLKGPTNRPISMQDLKSLDGHQVEKVTNSRFCMPEVLHKLAETLESAQIMQPSHVDEHSHIASHVTPGHALLAAHPPFYFNADAVNCAALDHLVRFTGKSDEDQVLKFLDLAGAPSGFSQYICWRRQQTAKGWGMVRIENPQLGPGRIVNQLAPWETFQVLGPHTGVNICDNDSIKSLCAGVENYCPDGVQLVMGDVPTISFGAHHPGFAEFQVKQNFLSQCICACKVLCKGGMFICRVYELLSRFSVGLVYLMYRLFQEVTILKPVTSSPTSPERFLVCRGYQGCRPILTEMLLAINNHITDLRNTEGSKQDVLEILPVQLLFEEQFYRYLTLSNERLARQRMYMVTSLEKYFINPEQLPSSEDLLRRGILEILQLPEKPSLP